ncbi:MAG: isochorismate synthase [Simkaniaceae bacterium]
MLLTNTDFKTLLEKLLTQLKEKKESSILSIDGEHIPLVRLSARLHVGNLLLWLSSQPYYPKAYFQDSNTGKTIIGLGSIFSIHSLPEIKAVRGKDISRLKLFGGMDFFGKPRKTALWKNFPPHFFFLPMIEIEQEGKEAILYLNMITPHNSFANYFQSLELILSSLDFSSCSTFASAKRILKRLDTPSFDDWEINVGDALHEIHSASFKKIVLARKTSLTFSEKLNPLQLLASPKGVAKNSAIFAFQFAPNEAFIGSSPEILYERLYLNIRSAAIAGTRPRGRSLKKDKQLLQELLNSDKDQREFDFVRTFMEKQLQKLCTELNGNMPLQVIQTDTVQHIYKIFEGTLKSEDNLDKKLISHLHPTPAMGGFPQTAAINFLYNLEIFDRGWYASPIGYLSCDASKFYIGIRSALVQDNVVHAFAGTGIVKGSTAQKEWEELNYKISHFSGSK